MNATAAGGELRALLARAAAFAARGDDRAAVAFYQTALKSVRNVTGLDRDTLAELQRAQAFVADHARQFQQSLEQAVAAASPADPVAALRLTHSLEILKGGRQVYPQQP